MRPISVIVADDHRLVREGLVRLLELDDLVRVVGVASNGEEAIRRTLQLRPDVVLMDLNMPVMDGVAAAREIAQIKSVETKVIILTVHADDAKVHEAIRAGASGYLLKDCDPSELVGAIVKVHRGEYSLSPGVLDKIIRASVIEPSLTETAASSEQLSGLLTPREREVLRLLAQGLTNTAISSQLVISEKTVKNHVSSILRKLDVRDRTQAAVWAYKHGLVSVDGS